MTVQQKLIITTLASALISTLPAMAEVSPADAAKLKTTLTPLGGERAGNKEGTIPAWDGGYTKAGDKSSGRREDPFAGEKPLFSITAKNMDQYAGKLTEGVKTLLTKYPDTYRLDVYTTHRTAAAPQWVYDNTFKNATSGKLAGDVPENVYGGIPFPIPKSGAEVMWNHVLRWEGDSYWYGSKQYQFTADGKSVLLSAAKGEFLSPYYFNEASWEKFADSQDFLMVRVLTTSPPIRAGEALLVRNNLNGEKSQGWSYLAGQRRVRKLPNPCCDTPNPISGGTTAFDEVYVWYGRLDRFDWKIVGKQEMYIPYNGNRLDQPTKDAAVLDAHHLNPDYVRWELHRVWVVEANLRQGKRHLAPKSRYYCDEDTWICVLGDRWDGRGELWKALWSIPTVAPDLPGVITGVYGVNDLQTGSGFVSTLFNEGTQYSTVKPRFTDNAFSPDALAGEGVR
jgi:hypothetical protein